MVVLFVAGWRCVARVWSSPIRSPHDWVNFGIGILLRCCPFWRCPKSKESNPATQRPSFFEGKPKGRRARETTANYMKPPVFAGSLKKADFGFGGEFERGIIDEPP